MVEVREGGGWRMEHEKDDPRMIPREKDEDKTSPLGRGADPGESVEGGPIEAAGPAGLHGHQSPHARGGPEGILHRENEDAASSTRGKGPEGTLTGKNDAGA